MDESGIDDNETYSYGWGPKGQRIIHMKRSNRHRRISIISALNQTLLQAPFVFEGYCNREVFEIYLEKILAPTLQPGQTVILDNASFHKSKKAREIIEGCQCRLLYLPAYSPDLNPIEHYWHSIKNTIRKILPSCDGDLYQASEYAFTTLST